VSAFRLGAPENEKLPGWALGERRTKQVIGGFAQEIDDCGLSGRGFCLLKE
jgi:hypothetical protein